MPHTFHLPQGPACRKHQDRVEGRDVRPAGRQRAQPARAVPEVDALLADPAIQRWQSRMKPLLDVQLGDGGTPLLDEVFQLDGHPLRGTHHV